METLILLYKLIGTVCHRTVATEKKDGCTYQNDEYFKRTKAQSTCLVTFLNMQYLD